MTTVQVAMVFNYNLLGFMTPLFEQAYLIGIICSLSEIVAYAVSGILFECMGAKFTFLVSGLTALTGGLLILFHGLDHQDSLSFPVFFLIAKFGVTCAYSIMVVSNARIFDVKQAATAFGSASFFARIVQTASPLISTVPQPLPVQIFCITITITAISTQFLKVGKRLKTKNALKKEFQQVGTNSKTTQEKQDKACN